MSKFMFPYIPFEEEKIMRSTRSFVLLLSLAGLAALAAACATTTPVPPTPVPPTPTALEMPTAASAATVAPTSAPTAAATNAAGAEVTGASLYQLSCAACHGADLKGSTFDVDGQKIEAPALGWEDLSTTFQTDPTRGDLATQLGLAITKGKDETGADLNAMMPRWSSLSQAQVDSLVQYMQTASTAGGAAPTLEPAAMNLTGEQLYAAACAACHGTDAAGMTFEKDGNKITTPSLHWGDLSQMYAVNPSRGDAAQQAALAITKGQDEKGEDLNPMMPRWSFLSQAQVDSLVQYLQTTFP